MKLADAFQEEPNVVIAELDADAHRDFAQKFDVHGCPTLKVATRVGLDADLREGPAEGLPGRPLA